MFKKKPTPILARIFGALGLSTLFTTKSSPKFPKSAHTRPLTDCETSSSSTPKPSCQTSPSQRVPPSRDGGTKTQNRCTATGIWSPGNLKNNHSWQSELSLSYDTLLNISSIVGGLALSEPLADIPFPSILLSVDGVPLSDPQQLKGVSVQDVDHVDYFFGGYLWAYLPQQGVTYGPFELKRVSE